MVSMKLLCLQFICPGAAPWGRVKQTKGHRGFHTARVYKALGWGDFLVKLGEAGRVNAVMCQKQPLRVVYVLGLRQPRVLRRAAGEALGGGEGGLG